MKAGNIYGYQHPIVKNKDTDFTFKNNAEECYLAMHEIFATRLYAAIFAVLLTAVVILGLVIRGYFLSAIIMGIVVSIALTTLTIKPKVHLNAIAMARRWKPVRKNLVKLLHSRRLPHKDLMTNQVTLKAFLTQIDDTMSQKEREFTENKDGVEAVMEEIAQRIADDKVLFQIHSHCDKHRKYDREKKLVDDIFEGMGWQKTSWTEHFRKAKVRYKLIDG